MTALMPVGGVAPLTSALVTQLLTRIDFREHSRGLAEHYRMRRDVAVAAVRAHLPEVAFAVPDGGFFLWLQLPAPVDFAMMLGRAGDVGVRFMPEPAFLIAAPSDRFVRLAFSYEEPERLALGIARLAGVLAEA